MPIQLNELTRKIQEIKGLNGMSSYFLIPIRNIEGIQIGSLRPIDTSLMKLPEVLEKLTRWRRMFARYFLTQFPCSEERTSQWLENIVFPSDDRILFLICDDIGTFVGNFGVCNIKPHEAELDNLIRGEKGGDPKLIFFAEIALLSWLYLDIGVNSVSLHVFSNNAKTISLHSNIGFFERQRLDLRRIQDGSDLRYFVNSNDGEPVNFQYIEMAMERSSFELLYPWTKSVYADR